MTAQNIDDVIAKLDGIVDWSRQHESRLGYFAALYRKMSVEVKRGIETSQFDDGERMHHIGAVFANRYLAAFDQFQQGRRPTRSWVLAFEATQRWRPTVLQHLVLGMNAHINLDLGIAMARSVRGDALPDAQSDFNKINDLLAHLIDQVQDELTEIWPLTRLLDRLGGRKDEFVINFSLERARDHAWQVAQRLAPLEHDAQELEIPALDAKVERIGRLVLYPGWILSTAFTFVRLGERASISDIIDILK